MPGEAHEAAATAGRPGHDLAGDGRELAAAGHDHARHGHAGHDFAGHDRAGSGHDRAGPGDGHAGSGHDRAGSGDGHAGTAVGDAAAFWDERYGSRERMWSGRPNQPLVDLVGHLAPGRALDLGCGEGADCVWLASRGWTVTGVDVSATAVGRAAEHAAERGVPDGRITWVRADLASWEPEATFDLVSACFLHSPIDFPRSAVLRRAAGAVARGGHLLVVSHAEAPPWASGHDHAEHRFPIPEDDLADLALDGGWTVLVNEVGEREGRSPDGEPATLRDVVTLVRRA